jgi:hypothetical protein
MSYEEKLIRYISSKIIQKKIFLKKHRLPSDKELQYYIGIALEKIKDKYKQYSLVRRHSRQGLLTPLIREIINDIKI